MTVRSRTRSWWKRWCVTAVLATVMLVGGHALADGLADEAELQFQLGADAYQKGEFRSALEHFLASNRLVPNKNVVFNIARTFEQLRRYADAHRYYVDALEGETNAKVLAELEAAIKRIAPSVAVLRVESDPAGATIYIERKDLGSRGKAPRPLAMPEGKYRVIAELDGWEPAVAEGVVAKTGAETNVTLKLTRIVGTVEVSAEGASGVTVHVDDERAPAACTAPCTLSLPPGRHLLFFTKEGYQAAPRQVNVTARQTTRTSAVLTPLTGTVVISADEREALVEIDGRPMGFTPAVIQNVAVGKRRVRVSLRGYTPIERDVAVKANEEVKLLDLRLLPLRQVAAVSRVTESIDDAPSSLTIIESQELRAFGYPTIAESLRGVRGVYLSNDRAYFSAGVRGLGEPNDYGNRVLVLSDGQPLNDNLINSSYIGTDGRADLHDVSRIEVVRGPGSLLYGTGAFSGVVNLVPRGRDEPSSVHAGAGTYDNSVARGRAGFHYNFTKNAGVWASASASRSDGVDVPVQLTDPGAGNPPVQTASFVDFHRAGGTAGRAWLGPVNAQWFVHKRLQRIPVGIYQTDFNDRSTLYDDTRFMGEVRFEPKIGEQLEVLVRTHANRYVFHGEYTYAPPSIEDMYGTWFGGELRVAYKPNERVRLTVGGEGQIHPEVEMTGRSGPDTYLVVDEPYQFGAGYALAEGTPVDWLKLSGGVRFDAYSTFGLIAVPRAAIIFKPRAGTVLKVMGGRAFRAPSVYEQFYSDGGDTQAAATDPARGLELGPESVYSGEVELSQRFLEDWVALGAVHASRVEDIITTIEDAPGSDVVRYANSPYPALLAGGDLELRREWRQGWMLSASYGYQRSQFLDSGADDPRLVNAPEHLASFKAVVPVAPDVASIGTRITYEAPRRIDTSSEDETRPAIVADLTVSGGVRRFGVTYVIGVYNVVDSRYDYPVVADAYLSRTMRQNGRTFLADVIVTYP